MCDCEHCLKFNGIEVRIRIPLTKPVLCTEVDYGRVEVVSGRQPLNASPRREILHRCKEELLFQKIFFRLPT